MKRPLFSALIALSASPAFAAATFFGPTPYLSSSDSPFIGLPGLSITTFEATGLPSTVTASSGVTTSPGIFTDSVDADDGAIDGSGTAGHSYYVQTPTVTFAFDPAPGQGLPTSAGLVWTDVGRVNGANVGSTLVTFEAFGPGGASLGTSGPFLLGDGSVLGETAEDRFFGVSSPDGISAISLTTANSDDWELDHLQFAGQVPEPSLLPALAAPGLLLAPRHSRSRLRRSDHGRHR